MICKGTTNNGAKLAAYLTTDKENERAELWQLRGFAATNIKDAFRDIQIMARATQCEAPFFHVQVRLRDNESLSREQWEYVADRIERMMGLEGQPRAIAFHHKEKCGEHMHVVFSRIDEDSLKAIPLPFFKRRLKTISRELEEHFGLELVPNHREDEIKFAPTRAEQEQARRLGLDIHEVRNTIRSCYERSDCGSSFRTALENEGFILAQGDRRDFVVIDPAGGVHAIGKRLLDETAAQVRGRLSDIDRDKLPTVEAARELIDRRAEEKKPFNWDRDRADRDWQDAVIEAGIRKSPVREGTSERQTATDDPFAKTITAPFPGEIRRRNLIRLERSTTRVLGKSLDSIGNAFESLFAPTLTPEQKDEGRRAELRRRADAERAIERARKAETLAHQQQEAELRLAQERDNIDRER